MSVDTTQAKEHAQRLERLVANGGDIEGDLESSTYALSGEAIISASDDPFTSGTYHPLAVDIRRVLLMVAGGGPTAYLAFDHEGRGFYLTNEWTDSEVEYYLGDDFGAIADYLAEKLGGWDQ